MGVALAALALASCLPPEPVALPESSLDALRAQLSEASTSFDRPAVQPFLVRVTEFVEGFEAEQVRALMKDLGDVRVGSERDWSYTVRHRGAEVPLRIHVWLGSGGDVDLYFFSTPDLADEILLEMRADAERRGV